MPPRGRQVANADGRRSLRNDDDVDGNVEGDVRDDGVVETHRTAG
jgi:hypothetical protein